MRDRKNVDESTSERELVIERTFDAPARLLFEAYSRPEHLRRWFGPRGWPLTLCEVDFRKGGRFRFQMTGPDGQKGTPFGGEYLEIEKDRKIVYDNGFELPGAERMVTTVTFEEAAGKTKLTMHTLFASVAMRASHVGGGFEQGVNSGFDQLVEVTAELVRGKRPGGELRPVSVSSFLTLDGYMVGPDEDISWVIEGFDPAMQADIAEYMAEGCDQFVFGRVTYEMFAAYWPTALPYASGDSLKPAAGREDPRIIRALNELPKLVISTTLPTPSWKNTRVIRDGLEREVQALKQHPGKAINVQGSARVVQALARADLVDEYRFYLHPVLLGQGKPLFKPGMSRHDFQLAGSKAYANGVLALLYRRKRAAA
jgi:uncharacterized protein YndB with AHSA1/START domain/dihydrofolate reductase